MPKSSGIRTEPTGKAAGNLYGGTSVPDASQVGVVYIEHLENQNDAVPCWFGTGVLLTNDVILTAAHVASYVHATLECGAKATPVVPHFMRITMPDPSATGGKQTALISCGTTAGCGERLHPQYDPAAGGSPFKNNNGEDVALIPLGTSSFVVKGIGLFYERPVSEKPVSDFFNTSVTCYGMSISTPKLPTATDAGSLRKADFTVLKFPHPQAILDTTTNPAVGQWLSGGTFNMFAVSRGGGVAVAPIYQAGGIIPEPIPVSGDSGGPCIKHTSATDGDLVGIDHAGSGATSGGVDTPEWAHYSAASGFRKWVRCRLKQRVTPKLLPCDLDGDSQADDGVGVRRSPGGSLVLVASFNNGAQELTLDTFIPETTADVGCAFPGDFDADGDDDIVTTIGTALAGLPAYLKGSASSSFSFASVPTWQPSGPYEYFSVGNFGNACVAPADADCKNDTIDDVVAVRFDGTEDVFLGESGAGLSTS